MACSTCIVPLPEAAQCSGNSSGVSSVTWDSLLQVAEIRPANPGEGITLRIVAAELTTFVPARDIAFRANIRAKQISVIKLTSMN